MNREKNPETLLAVKNLAVHFALKRSGFWKGNTWLKAVDDISFSVRRGRTLGIVGESGSGKTTAALAVARLIKLTSGSVVLDDTDLASLPEGAMREARAEMQFIFQDPYSSLNPRLRAEDIVRAPLRNLPTERRETAEAGIDDLFQAVGLRPEQKRLFPHQFSGGQRQRIGIARALATGPKLIICDEPVSALDVAVQAQILNLLRELQASRYLTYLFISHDLGVVQYMCDEIIVMYMGKIVEQATRRDLFTNPRHPYTQALLSAVPSVDPSRRSASARVLIPGDPPDASNLPTGCRFSGRCPVAKPICQQTEPDLIGAENGHWVACHVANPPPE